MWDSRLPWGNRPCGSGDHPRVGAMTAKRSILFVSSGSMDAAIVQRNAMSRLLFSTLDGFFARVDYVFFPADEDGVYDVADGFRVYDVAGRAPGARSKSVSWLERAARLRRGYARIRAIADEAQPDVIAVVEPFLSGLVGRALARRLGKPLVTYVVSNYKLSFRVAALNPIPFLPPALTFAVEGFVLRNADLVLCDCLHYRDYALSRGAREKLVQVFPRYAADVFYDAEADAGIWRALDVDDEAPLVYVGRLSPEKYVLDLIEAFARIRRHFPDKHLVILGSGPQEEEFLVRARALGVAEFVHIRKGLDQAQVFSCMAGSSVMMVMHGGYALLEAGLAGAAVVAYDYEWHPELIEDGVTGRLVPYRDAGALADAAVEMLRDPEGARAMGARLRALCDERYRSVHSRVALRGCYDALLEGRR